MRLLLFSVSLVISYLSIILLIAKGGLSLDKPNHRSSHLIPTPRGGGVGFFVATLVSYCLFLGISFVREIPISLEAVKVIGFSIAFGLVGLIEDLSSLSSKRRFLIELGLALAAAYFGLRWTSIDLIFASFSLSTFTSILISALWIVWVANLYNFMDGINGIAGLQGIILSIFFGYILNGIVPDLSLFSLCLGFGLTGFIRFNFPRAKIFMGDCGSLFLGGFFALMPLHIHQQEPRFSIVLAILLLSPFFIDTLVTIIIRAVKRENIMSAHCTHAYQRLARASQSHAKITIAYAFVSIVFCTLVQLEMSDPTGHHFYLYSALVLFAMCVFFILVVERKSSSIIKNTAP